MTKVINLQLAYDIAKAHREIKAGTDLLEEIEKALDRSSLRREDIRDEFGRRVSSLQLAVPSGPTSKTLFDVPYTLARPVINAHIAAQQSLLEALSLQALEVMKGEM